MIALKQTNSPHPEEGIPTTALREISVLKTIQHENVVALLDVVNEEGKLFLIFELGDLDLKKHMEGHPEGLPLSEIKRFTYELLSGVDACHATRLLHRDLKPQNLLLCNGTLKVGDFGLVRAFSVPMRVYTHEVVTLWYRAPEILLGSKHYTTSVDTWSVGAILAEMATSKPLFPGDSQIGELFQIFQVLGTPTEATWPGVSKLPDFKQTFPSFQPSGFDHLLPKIGADGVDLLKKLLAYDPAERISASRALQHPFFADM
ncbi:cyclin-dependent kinase liike [Carpediemonas membranifera]|uniref:cyclin-dependent kinase n=1 Tax=Carpediemonas membranifera TaxID=201153 RepID=A0A8J6B0T3_9EUKA|nr:cyclin-dependent kinase liike [Carpediemonas membranifera]|eukprot:KAG9390509.1 cyclin-dependent kinase liike [Carpediemonas membranifera]